MNLSWAGICLTADTAVDLHLHTTFSDGLWTLEALFDELLREPFGLAAVTDHDRVDTAAVVQQLALDKHLPILVGVEMTTTWQGKITDLLCYGFDPKHNGLADLALNLLRRQQENTREVFENLRKQNCILPCETLQDILAKPGSKQPHALVSLLKEHGYGLGQPSAGKMVMQAGCSFAANDPAAVVEAAHRSGAVCLIAHPGRDEGYITYDEQALDQLRREVAIDGLEVYYPAHTPAQTAMYLDYAHRHHLLVSAGSDSHGPDQPPIKYRAELSRSLLEHAGIQIPDRSLVCGW